MQMHASVVRQAEASPVLVCGQPTSVAINCRGLSADRVFVSLVLDRQTNLDEVIAALASLQECCASQRLRPYKDEPADEHGSDSDGY
jgi:hypothetical protein